MEHPTPATRWLAQFGRFPERLAFSLLVGLVVTLGLRYDNPFVLLLADAGVVGYGICRFATMAAASPKTYRGTPGMVMAGLLIVAVAALIVFVTEAKIELGSHWPWQTAVPVGAVVGGLVVAVGWALVCLIAIPFLFRCGTWQVTRRELREKDPGAFAYVIRCLRENC